LDLAADTLIYFWWWPPLIWLVLIQWFFTSSALAPLFQFIYFCWGLSIAYIALVDTGTAATLICLIEGLILLLAKDALEYNLRGHCIWHIFDFPFRGIDNLIRSRQLPRRGKPGPKSRPGATHWKKTFSFLLCVFLLFMEYPMQHQWGEGSDSAMGITEVPHACTQTPLMGTKRHGMQPTLCISTSAGRETTNLGNNKVIKRSIRRAYRRSLHSGFAWYRGKHYSADEFAKMGCALPEAPVTRGKLTMSQRQDWQRCNSLHSAKKRLTMWQWNCGGISASRLDEVKAWLVMSRIDIAVLLETRLTFDSNHSDTHWHILHSGEGAHRGKGIMFLVAKSLCKATDIAWQFHDSGRLVHLRLNVGPRPMDVVACYQHAYQSSPACLKAREQWWNLLESVLTNIPNRHGLAVLGDFNCSVSASRGLVGTSNFQWQGKPCTGTVHSDQSRFLQLLRQFALVVLNSWSAQDGPTYVHGDAASRIDHFCVRQCFADGEARRVTLLWESPFLQQTKVGHAPMLCSIAQHWIPQFARSRIQRVTMQQRQESRLAYIEQTPCWQAFTVCTQHQLMQIFATDTAGADEVIDTMHHQIMHTFIEHFPSGQTNRTAPPWTTALPIILNKWEHRRRMLRPGLGTVRNVFKTWFHQTKYCRLRRAHNKQAKQIRQSQFREVVKTAAEAAARHATHKLFSLINRFAPKQPRKQIQLRNHAGHMASPIESAAIMNRYIAQTWAGPTTLDLQFDQAPGVPFDVRQLAQALRMIPCTKATAKPFAPGVVWHQHADFLAPLLHEKLCIWWACNPPHIPCSWKNGWIFMIPKPSKPPVSPCNLRPLALQEPVGKAIIGLLIHLAMKEASPCMVHLPLWAYLEHRSTLDAIRRVSLHCAQVRQLIRSQKSTPHSRVHRNNCSNFYGGIQVCLDLQRAFDAVDRRKLFAKLYTLQISPSIIQLLACWHENTFFTFYHVDHGEVTESIQVGKGVRQGCKAAPGLWSFFLVIFLQELMAWVPLTWIQNCLTIYADDFHICMTYTTMAELQHFQSTLGILLSTLASMDMQVNPGKSVALLEMRGTQSRAARRHFVRRFHDGEKLIVPVPGHDDAYIPIQTSTKYLGVIISYHNFEDASLKHRLQLMQVGFRRLNRWLTGKHSLSIAQRFQIWRTCIFPIFSYGVFATGMTQTGITKAMTQMTIMLRRIIHDHAYLTRRTNSAALASRNIPTPAQLLHGIAAGLLRSHATRAELLPPHDLTLTITWDHLPELLHRLHQLQATESLEQQHPTLEAGFDTPFFQCAQCEFCTASVSAFRGHCTTHHQHTMYRTQHVQPEVFSTGGLPTCQYCQKTFTTWRLFHIHIERGCQALLTGPSPFTGNRGDTGSTLSRLTGMTTELAHAAARGLRLITEEELHNLKQQTFGPRLLQLVQDREWDRLPRDQEACRYLATQCIICAFHFSRPQELHQHYRLRHPELWEYAPQKAIQLTNIFSDEVPCSCCGALFLTHTCPTWSQVAVLLVNGAGNDDMEVGPVVEARQRCELCLEWFSTAAELVQHLQNTHGLQGLSYNESRDSLDNTTACSHCGILFMSMSGLKSHIVQGRCDFFNPQATAETQPVDDQWRMACLEGKLHEVLQQPANRLRLTVTCQACGKGCRRAADLALHLQSCHARLWRQARRLTMLLVEILYPKQCYCNPATGTKRNGHICLPFRQLAMSFHRLGKEPFAPMLITDPLLKAILSDLLTRADKYKIEQVLVHRQFEAMWQDLEILQSLRRQCIFCGTRCTTADLALHLREEHCCSHEMFLFYMEQLLPTIHALDPAGYQCTLCQQIFNLPVHLQPDEPLADRVHLALSHLRGNCPCLIQIALLFGSILNGSPLSHGATRPHSVGTGDGGIQQFGTVIPGQDASADSQSQKGQGPTTGRQRTPRRGQANARQRTDSTTAPAVNTGSACGQTRSRASMSSQNGSIHTFFGPRTHGCTSHPVTGDSPMEEADGDIQIHDSATETAPDDHPAESPSHESREGGGMSGDGPAVLHVPAERSDLGRSELPFSSLGPAAAEGGSGQETACERTENEAAPGGTPGHGAGQGAHCSISCPTTHVQLAQSASAMEAPDSSPERQALRALVATGAQLGVDDSGSHDETTQSGTIPAGDHVAEHDATQRKGQGQDTSIRAETGGMTSEVHIALHERLVKSMTGLRMANDRNWCYGNSVVHCMLWTLLCLQNPTPTQWGLQFEALIDFITRHATQLAVLKDISWFQQVLTNWGQSQGQRDSAECAQRLLAVLGVPAFDMRWERRLIADGTVQTLDHSMDSTPIHLTITSQMHSCGHCNISDLIATWTQEHSMRTALLAAPPCLCVSVERFLQTEDDALIRSMCSIDLDTEASVPVFKGSGIEIAHEGYIPIAGVAHFGLDCAGHCRAILKMQPGLVNQTQPATWLLSEDAQRLEPAWKIPSDFATNLTVTWLVRTDCLHLPAFAQAAARSHTDLEDDTSPTLMTPTPDSALLSLLQAQPGITMDHMHNEASG